MSYNSGSYRARNFKSASCLSDFEINRCITPWIELHSVQLLLLINPVDKTKLSDNWMEVHYKRLQIHKVEISMRYLTRVSLRGQLVTQCTPSLHRPCCPTYEMSALYWIEITRIRTDMWIVSHRTVRKMTHTNYPFRQEIFDKCYDSNNLFYSYLFYKNVHF